MSSPHLNTLIKIAREDLPQLTYDINNAATLYTLQEAVKKLHNIIAYIVHHTVLSDPNVQAAMATRAPAPQPRYAPAAPQNYGQGYGQAPIGSAPPMDYYPHDERRSTVPMQQAPAPVSTNPLGLPNIGGEVDEAPPNSGVAEVTITPQGTRVNVPGAGSMRLPPGTAVQLAPEEPPPGVVLPRGGAMTDEVNAALAASQSSPPPPDTAPSPRPAPARNITHDPAP